MADVRTEIAGLPPLTRAGERTRVQSRLDQNAACFLVGDSGSGKSALAKAIAAASYPRVVWLGPHNLDCETPADFERSLGINRPLSDILNATAERCLVVFDGVERFDLRAIRLTCRLIADIHADGAAPHVHFLLTAQFEAANQLVRRFVEFAAPECAARTRADNAAVSYRCANARFCRTGTSVGIASVRNSVPCSGI